MVEIACKNGGKFITEICNVFAFSESSCFDYYILVRGINEKLEVNKNVYETILNAWKKHNGYDGSDEEEED